MTPAAGSGVREPAEQTPFRALRRAWTHTRLLVKVAQDTWWTSARAECDRAHLEQEWDFASPAARDRNARLFAAIARQAGATGWGRALELGCAEGLLTVKLAAQCASVVACDISPVACQRARQRCAAMKNVTVVEASIEKMEVAGPFDIIFLMDVICYVHGRRRLMRMKDRLAALLRPGGLLAFSECRLPTGYYRPWWRRWFPEGADAVLELLAADPRFVLLESQPHPESGELPGYVPHVLALLQRA